MELAIFASKKTTRDGKPFTAYSSHINKKDGTSVYINVKFRQEAGAPKAENCPANIIVKKEECNMQSREYVREDTGEVGMRFTLWVSKWEPSKNPYVDHSLDDFVM